ncbi:sucrose cleavage family protein [Moniliophthora roreri]|nr:sucrose cleavage family protein [Moniliophthora roreri]
MAIFVVSEELKTPDIATIFGILESEDPVEWYGLARSSRSTHLSVVWFDRAKHLSLHVHVKSGWIWLVSCVLQGIWTRPAVCFSHGYSSLSKLSFDPIYRRILSKNCSLEAPEGMHSVRVKERNEQSRV